MALYFGFGSTFQAFSKKFTWGLGGYDSLMEQAKSRLPLVFRVEDAYEDHHWDLEELGALRIELDQVIAENGDHEARDFAERLKALVADAEERQEALYVYCN